MGPSCKHLILDLELASRTRSNQFDKVGGLAGREESDGSPVAWIRASAARIRRITGSAACLEAQADEALPGTRRRGGFSRSPSRGTTSGSGLTFLLESLPISWFTTTGRRCRKAVDTRGFAVY